MTCMVYVENGLCKVRPYFATKRIWAKGRWLGRSVKEVLAAEFRNRSMAAHEEAMAAGHVALLRHSGLSKRAQRKAAGSANPDTPIESTFTVVRIQGPSEELAHAVLQNKDVVEYRAHVHEPPVTSSPGLAHWAHTADPSQWLAEVVVHETQDCLIICKPAGIPVHPTGRYSRNTLTDLLEQALGYKVYASHRLDRLTSGLLVLGKTAPAAASLSERLREKSVSKEYVALVRGSFPPGPQTVVTAPIFTTQFSDGSAKFAAGLRAAADCATQASTRDGPKPASTRFEGVWYDERRNVSLVRCAPLTGRTHQIRKHLAIAGHAICDDPVYSHPAFPELHQAVLAALDGGSAQDQAVAAFEKIEQFVRQGMHDKMRPGETCGECGAPLFEDPDPRDLRISLHAVRYSAVDGSFDYSVPLPTWARLS